MAREGEETLHKVGRSRAGEKRSLETGNWKLWPGWLGVGERRRGEPWMPLYTSSWTSGGGNTADLRRTRRGGERVGGGGG